MDIYERLRELGIELYTPKPPIGIYVPMKEFGGKYVYTSGHGCDYKGVLKYIGKVGEGVSLEEGIWSARQCVINILGNLHNQLGDLNRIKKVIKVLGFVASGNNFFDQPKVMNGASQLLVDIFGEENGKAARSAIGVNVLPKNQPVEVEIIFELK
jgi:enamine deaminase RidA (YjgF/YER057c/UK114 family)